MAVLTRSFAMFLSRTRQPQPSRVRRESPISRRRVGVHCGAFPADWALGCQILIPEIQDPSTCTDVSTGSGSIPLRHAPLQVLSSGLSVRLMGCTRRTPQDRHLPPKSGRARKFQKSPEEISTNPHQWKGWVSHKGLYEHYAPWQRPTACC